MHADKSWTVANEADRKAVRRTSAVVKASVFASGRVVGFWDHAARAREVAVTVTRLTGWDAALVPQAEAQAQEFAAHVGVEAATVAVA